MIVHKSQSREITKRILQYQDLYLNMFFVFHMISSDLYMLAAYSHYIGIKIDKLSCLSMLQEYDFTNLDMLHQADTIQESNIGMILQLVKRILRGSLAFLPKNHVYLSGKFCTPERTYFTYFPPR